MKTIFIVPNLRKKGIDKAVSHLCSVLRRHKTEILLPRYSPFMIGEPSVSFVDVEEGTRRADFIISMGGDGTMLRIAGLAARYNTPLLGINLGHLGFITALEADEIDLVEQIFEGRYKIDQRMMLDVTVVRNDQTIYSATALNEVIVTKLNPSKVVRIMIQADDTPVIDYRGDGLIVATPTGTTAYSYSAGGPIIEPTAENIALTPVCPFTGRGKSFVFAPERTISVQASERDGGGACISADGEQTIGLRPDDVVYIRRSESVTRLITIKECSFYDILHQKLSDGGIDG